jgi:hypothetical protein
MSELPFDDPPSLEIDANVARDLAALADGSLEPARRAEVEALAARSPELAAALAEQLSAVALMASAREISGSAQFHDGVRQLARRRSVYPGWLGRGQRSTRLRADGDRSPRQRKLGLATAGGSALAVLAAIVIAASLGGHGSSMLRLPAYVTFAARPATIAAPAKAPGHGGLLAIAVDGLAFPDWEHSNGWRAVGVRADLLRGHAVTTVFYADASGARIGYSIVAPPPPPLTWPKRSTVVSRAHVHYWVQTVGGVPVIAWTHAGHRCVLSGRGVSSKLLLALATGQGHGGRPT